ncbi:MAG TPA: hypothetical protein VJN93_06015 [Candidatus Acidoferrum sp.]|nr:hypothetical protein [Candidatus Acidoferrum sp.]
MAERKGRVGEKSRVGERADKGYEGLSVAMMQTTRGGVEKLGKCKIGESTKILEE